MTLPLYFTQIGNHNIKLQFAGLGPPVSQGSGGVSPRSFFAHASLAHATCFTCSANVRTSASEVKSRSTIFHM